MKKLLEKLKNVNYKSKKHIVHYAVIFALIVTGTATGLMIRAFAENSVNSNSIVEDKHNHTSDKETSDETSKEENSKEENSNLSDNNSSNSTSQSNSSADTNTANLTNSTPSTNNNTNTNTSSNNNSPSNNTNSNNKPTQPSKPQQPEQPKPHTHTWVHYKEQGHSAKVLVKDSWTELVPKYETQIFTVCNACDWVVASPDKPFNENEYITHSSKHLQAGQPSGHHDETRQVQVGVDKIEHPAEYKDEWIVDTPAYDQCSTCGEKK